MSFLNLKVELWNSSVSICIYKVLFGYLNAHSDKVFSKIVGVHNHYKFSERLWEYTIITNFQRDCGSTQSLYLYRELENFIYFKEHYIHLWLRRQSEC